MGVCVCVGGGLVKCVSVSEVCVVRSVCVCGGRAGEVCEC